MTQTHHNNDTQSSSGGEGSRGSEPYGYPQDLGYTGNVEQAGQAADTAPVWYGQEGGGYATTQEVPYGYQPYPGRQGYGEQGYGDQGGYRQDAQGGYYPAYGSSPQTPAGPPPPTSPRDGAAHGQPANRRRWADVSAAALLAAVLASGGTYAATQLGSQDSPSSSTTSSSSSLGRGTDQGPVRQADANNPNWTVTAAAVSPSVVSITVETASSGAQGSGVVIDDKGHVLTNNHVVAGAGNGANLTVTLNDGRTYTAKVAGTDPSTDLAVITLDSPPKDLKPIAIGNSADLKVGDPVMAIGNPLGLAGTVTTGIVSALNRPVTTSSSESQSPFDQSGSQPVVTNAIQTSAAINPGNSGGALVNASGQLVGINSSIATLGGSQGSQSGSIGIGFAIPVNEATMIGQQLIKDGSAQHSYLGVSLRDGRASDGNATRAGAQIVRVYPGTPAAAAGLKEGDVVIAVDGDQVDSTLSLIGSVRERAVGQHVTLTVVRGGKQVKVGTTLARTPSGQNQ